MERCSASLASIYMYMYSGVVDDAVVLEIALAVYDAKHLWNF